MQIEWKTTKDQSPYLFLQRAEWTGLKAHRAQVVPGVLREHSDVFHHINIALSGDVCTRKISGNGRAFNLKGGTGEFCITPAGQYISAHWDNPLDNLGLLFDPEFVRRTALENRFSPTFELLDSGNNQDSLIPHIGLALLANRDSETPAGKLYTDSLIQTLTLHLLKNYSTASFRQENTNGGLSGYKLRHVQEYINENLSEDLSLAEIAEVAGLSQFHFARAFRKTTGQTPQQYLMRQRIERAKELLAKKDTPIIEISLQTGFKNQSHFTTLFRKFTKLTPKTWRETAKK